MYEEIERARLYANAVVASLRTVVSAAEIDRDGQCVDPQIMLPNGETLSIIMVGIKSPNIIELTTVKDPTDKKSTRIIVLISHNNFQIIIRPMPKGKTREPVKFNLGD